GGEGGAVVCSPQAYGLQPAMEPPAADLLVSVAYVKQEMFGNCYVYGVLQNYARLGWLREI
ncbi:unnamed protein product, partial [Amoebophrya sp. A25]